MTGQIASEIPPGERASRYQIQQRRAVLPHLFRWRSPPDFQRQADQTLALCPRGRCHLTIGM